MYCHKEAQCDWLLACNTFTKTELCNRQFLIIVTELVLTTASCSL